MQIRSLLHVTSPENESSGYCEGSDSFALMYHFRTLKKEKGAEFRFRAETFKDVKPSGMRMAVIVA